jgi:hypothetical protein
MLAGLDDEAAFELSCEKWRVEGAFKSAASGAVLEASGLELRSKLEAVVAANLLRDAIVECCMTDTRSSRKFHGHRRVGDLGASYQKRVHDITIPSIITFATVAYSSGYLTVPFQYDTLCNTILKSVDPVSPSQALTRCGFSEMAVDQVAYFARQFTEPVTGSGGRRRWACGRHAIL